MPCHRHNVSTITISIQSACTECNVANRIFFFNLQIRRATFNARCGCACCFIVLPSICIQISQFVQTFIIHSVSSNCIMNSMANIILIICQNCFRFVYLHLPSHFASLFHSPLPSPAHNRASTICMISVTNLFQFTQFHFGLYYHADFSAFESTNEAARFFMVKCLIRVNHNDVAEQ